MLEMVGGTEVRRLLEGKADRTLPGNFHTFLAFKTDEELKAVRGLVHRMVKRALALDGTCKSCAA